mmetsp:Transcript_35918/g.67012  ORF Transcript_35918/g.67012 Transcript_35918/m.67012 type:complete len:535 (+) Transcript_35918:147-1751(+)
MVNLQGVKEMVGCVDAVEIIEVLSRVLTQLIDLNRNVTSKQQLITKFQSSYPPSITILAYLERINKYAKCSPNCFIIALIYIDRLIETRNVILSTLNVHRVLITSVMLAAKVFDDEFYKNAYYAKLGGVSTQEMNSLELEFLSLMNFDFFVTVETFEKYQKELLAFRAPPSASPNPVFVGLESSVELGAEPHGLSTPSPAALMSCGHVLGSLGQPSQSVPSVPPVPSLMQDSGGAGGMANLAAVVVPLTYEEPGSEFGTITPPPLGVATQQQSYFSTEPPMDMQQHSQHQQHQQHVTYPGAGGAGGDVCQYADMHTVSQCALPHPQSQHQQLPGRFAKSYGLQQAPGLYPGPGNYITPVTTPTSVAEAVFSWGSGERDGGVAPGCGTGGGGGQRGNACGAMQQQQQHHQQMMRLNPPTQLFPPHYYHQPGPPCNPSNHPPYPVPPQMPGHYAAPAQLSSPFNYGVPAQQQNHQSYFTAPHPTLQPHHVGHLQHHNAQQFASPSHPMQQQRFVVTAGGGGVGSGPRGYWAVGGGG